MAKEGGREGGRKDYRSSDRGRKGGSREGTRRTVDGNSRESGFVDVGAGLVVEAGLGGEAEHVLQEGGEGGRERGSRDVAIRLPPSLPPSLPSHLDGRHDLRHFHMRIGQSPRENGACLRVHRSALDVDI